MKFNSMAEYTDWVKAREAVQPKVPTKKPSKKATKKETSATKPTK